MNASGFSALLILRPNKATRAPCFCASEMRLNASNVVPAFNYKEIFGHHFGGTEFGFADGSVRFIKDSIIPKVLDALVTRNGGELISADDF